MKNNKLVFWTVLLCSVLFAEAATAAIPKLINLEGKLMDADGNALTGYYNMSFKIYNASSGGTLLWDENHTGINNVSVSAGLFNVLLGSINALELNFSENYWVEIKIVEETLAPRQRIASSGYAYRAAGLTCDEGGDCPVTGNLNVNQGKFFVNATSSNVGIGTTGPGAKLEVSDGTNAQILLRKTGADASTASIYNDGSFHFEGTATSLFNADTFGFLEVTNHDWYARLTTGGKLGLNTGYSNPTS